MKRMSAIELIERYEKGERDFDKLNLRSVCLINCVLDGASFCEADFTYANLTGSSFQETKCCDALFSQATLHNVNFADANLARTNFRAAQLTHARFFWANLAGAKLHGANLYGTDLRGANLAYAEGNILRLALTWHELIATKGWIQIGCEGHPTAYWLSRGSCVAQLYNYTEERYKEYERAVKMAAAYFGDTGEDNVQK